MIIPSFLPTATERILPRLAIDFTSAALDPRITFTRSGATATRVNASGLIEIVAADTARFDFDPATLVCRGLLIETQRENKILNSGNWAAASWTASANGGATISVTANSGTAPDGTNTATKIDFNAVSGQEAVVRTNTVSVTNGQKWSSSFYAKALASGDVGKQILFRHVGAGAYTTATLTADWVRYSNVETAPATFSPDMQVGLRPVIGGGSSGAVSALFWGCQLELGDFASSHIPTTTTSQIRNADVASMTSTNFSSWWQATTGAVTVRARQISVLSTFPWLQFDDTTADNIIALRGNTTNPELYIKATTDQAQIDAGTIAANTNYGLAGAWNTNDCAAALNGAAAVSDPSATIPTVTQARLGSDGTNYLNGWLQSVRYWPQRITDAEIQAFSKL